MLRQEVMDRHGSEWAIGVIDASANAKQGDKTPGVKRQWCGDLGKKESCTVSQHLPYTNNEATRRPKLSGAANTIRNAMKRHTETVAVEDVHEESCAAVLRARL